MIVQAELAATGQFDADFAGEANFTAEVCAQFRRYAEHDRA